jgi:hypothetical protein
MGSNSCENMEICLVVEFDVLSLKKKKEEEEMCIYEYSLLCN